MRTCIDSGSANGLGLGVIGLGHLRSVARVEPVPIYTRQPPSAAGRRIASFRRTPPFPGRPHADPEQDRVENVPETSGERNRP